MPSIQLIPYPMMDGNELSSASIEANFAGGVFAGFTALDYGVEVTPGEVRGASQRVLATTAGDEKFTASTTMRKTEYENYRARLTAGSGQGYMMVRHPITVCYYEIGMTNPITDVLLGCRIVKDQDSHKQGVEGLMVQITYHVMRIMRGNVDNPVFPIPIL